MNVIRFEILKDNTEISNVNIHVVNICSPVTYDNRNPVFNMIQMIFHQNENIGLYFS